MHNTRSIYTYIWYTHYTCTRTLHIHIPTHVRYTSQPLEQCISYRARMQFITQTHRRISHIHRITTQHGTTTTHPHTQRNAHIMYIHTTVRTYTNTPMYKKHMCPKRTQLQHLHTWYCQPAKIRYTPIIHIAHITHQICAPTHTFTPIHIAHALTTTTPSCICPTPTQYDYTIWINNAHQQNTSPQCC